jgi:signal transduction histidine kinase
MSKMPSPLHPPVAQRRRELASKRYLTLFERLTLLIGGHDQNEVSLRACELMAEILRVEACSIFLLDEGATRLHLMAATHIPPDTWSQIDLPLDEGICAEAMKRGEAQWIRSRRQFIKQFGRDPNQSYHVAACVVVPLRVRSQIVGVINIAHPTNRRGLRQRDVDLIVSAAMLVSQALETAIRHNETSMVLQNLEGVFDSLHVGILAVNAEEQVTHANHRSRQLFGQIFPSQEAPLTLTDALAGTIYNVCQRLMNQATIKGEPLQERLRAQLAGGSLMLEVTVSRTQITSESPSEYLIMFADVGNEEEVARLRESEQMKHCFMSTISHELRTPLAVIRGALPLIDPAQDRELNPDTLLQVHRILMRNCKRLEEVVGTILDVTELESGTLTLARGPVDLHEILEELIKLYTDSATSKHLDWDCSLKASTAVLQVDERRIRQVLSEMIANAIKFSHVNGRVSIHTRRDQGEMEIRIANTGEAIAPEEREVIFEKFYQTNQSLTRTAGGCGLGLFLAQNILRLHGGRIELLESDHKETVFSIKLPLNGGGHEGSGPTAASHNGGAGV